MTINLTVTALIRFYSSQDRVALGDAFRADTDYFQRFKSQFVDKTDFKIHSLDKLTGGRSFVDEAAAQEWIDLIRSEARRHGIPVANARIIPYIGEVYLEFLPV